MTTPRKPKKTAKRRKPATARPIAAVIIPSPDGFDSEAMLRATALTLQAAFDALEGIGAGDPDETEAAAKNMARIGAVISQVHAQLRQIEKKAKREIASIPLDQLVSHIKTLPESTRGDIAREITGADDQEPLL